MLQRQSVAAANRSPIPRPPPAAAAAAVATAGTSAHHQPQLLAASAHSAALATTQSMRIEPLQPGEVWYLAFGSNLSPRTLTGRRRVQPRQSLPCFVPTHRLSFNLHGLPFAEPGFATIVPATPATAAPTAPAAPASSSSSHQRQRRQLQPDGTPACLHGVLHRIDRQQWARIKASEGVLDSAGHRSSSSSDVGYQLVEVDCHLYDDRNVIRAVTLQAAPASLHKAERRALPSARYLKLLQEGSRHHGLDSHYIHWLERLQSYQPSGLQAAVGSLASAMLLVSAASTALPAYMASQAMRGNPAGSGAGDEEGVLAYVARHANAAQRLVWAVHDAVLEPVLGSGCSNPQQQSQQSRGGR